MILLNNQYFMESIRCFFLFRGSNLSGPGGYAVITHHDFGTVDGRIFETKEQVGGNGGGGVGNDCKVWPPPTKPVISGISYVWVPYKSYEGL